MSKSRAYRSYEDTREGWLGAIPSHWTLARLGGHFKERRTKVSDKVFSALSVTMQGIVPQLENAAKSNDGDNRKQVLKGDFVINSRSDRKGSSGVSHYDGSVSLICIVLEPREIVPSFAHHLFRSEAFQEEFYRHGKGIVADLWSTNYSAMKNIAIPVMPRREQTQIAKFLDYETAKIDALIEKQQQLIALLKEKRQAVISHAVTKGLNPDAPMRDSGVEWLGEVPAHWATGQMRRWIVNMEQGKSPDCESRPAATGEWGVLKTSCVNRGIYSAQENKALPATTSPLTQYEVKIGDLLMSRASGSTELIGSVAYVEQTPDKILLSDKIFRLRMKPDVDPKFFNYLMASDLMRSNIVRSISGAEGMANNITKGSILGFSIPVPPKAEQHDLVVYLSNSISKISQLIKNAAQLQELLTERRTALISAAVTGKIDVREWQPPADYSAIVSATAPATESPTEEASA